MTVGIYGIFNSKTGECLYVGLSKNIKERWRQHIKNLHSKKHKRQDFVEWYHKNGATAELLDFRVLEECDTDEAVLNLCEIKWFNKLLPKYYGKKPSKNERWEITEETKQKISEWNDEKYNAKRTLIEDQIELIKEMANDPDITRKEAADRLEVSLTYLKTFIKNKDIKWIFKRQLAIRRDKHQEILDAYFDEKLSIRELAKRYSTTLKTIIRIFALYRETDPRFKQLYGHKNLGNSKRSGTNFNNRTKKCQYCEKMIGLNTLKKHELACKI